MTPTEINAESPLKPVFFKYDSDELDDEARAVLSDNADVLRDYASWVITIEGPAVSEAKPRQAAPRAVGVEAQAAAGHIADQGNRHRRVA